MWQRFGCRLSGKQHASNNGDAVCVWTFLKLKNIQRRIWQSQEKDAGATRKTSKLSLSGTGRLLVVRRWWAKDHQAEGVDIKSDHQQQRENVDREGERQRGECQQTAQSKSKKPAQNFVVKPMTHSQLRQRSCTEPQSALQKYISRKLDYSRRYPHNNNSNSLLFKKYL